MSYLILFVGLLIISIVMIILLYANIVHPISLEKWRNMVHIQNDRDVHREDLNKRDIPYERKKVAVICYDNRKNDDIDKLRRMNEEYCRKRGYDFLFYDSYPGDDYYSPYWIKVKILKDSLINYDYLMWIDSDACIINSSIRIEDLFIEDKFFILSCDKDFMNYQFNAGVWLIKNCPLGHQFMEEWLNRYDKTRWNNNNGKWTCQGKWAGDDYEQGSGWNLILNKRYFSKVLCLPWQTMQGVDKNNKDAFTIHFYGKDRKPLIKML